MKGRKRQAHCGIRLVVRHLMLELRPRIRKYLATCTSLFVCFLTLLFDMKDGKRQADHGIRLVGPNLMLELRPCTCKYLANFNNVTYFCFDRTSVVASLYMGRCCHERPPLYS
jgi:hypothetical protein